MATGPLSGYAGDVKLTSGINPSGGKDIPLVDAHYIAADQKLDENGKPVIIRLDEKLEEMAAAIENAGSGLYVLELAGTGGTLTDEQYAALVANVPNVVCKVDYGGQDVYILFTLKNSTGDYGFVSNVGGSVSNDENAQVVQSLIIAAVRPNKLYEVYIAEKEMATKSYVDSLFNSYITDVDTLIGGDS